MAWSAALQEEKDRLLAALLTRCMVEVQDGRPITPETEPAALGIFDEDLDDVQIDAAARCGLRQPYPGEPLVVPWHGSDHSFTVDDLAGWLAANCRPLDFQRPA